MIKHVHLTECHSTQDVLKEQLKSTTHESLLVSCEHQLSGRGRQHKQWISMPGTLCFSMNVLPHPIFSFTAIEMAVILCDFFQTKNKNILLKWPNDLWTEDYKKCGGILINGNDKQLLSGIGINLFSDSIEWGGVYDKAFELDKKKVVLEMAEFILENRITDGKLLKKKWLNKCAHLGKKITLTEGEEKIQGTFVGIGDFGEALIEENFKITKAFNGTLTFTSSIV